MMKVYLMVAAGGALGSVVRFWLATLVASRGAQAFWGTLLVNVVGSLLIGIIASMRGGDFTRHFWIVGVMGGFTTFSSFSLQTLELFQKGHVGLAAANIGLSVLVCLAAVWIGWQLGKSL